MARKSVLAIVIAAVGCACGYAILAKVSPGKLGSAPYIDRSRTSSPVSPSAYPWRSAASPYVPLAHRVPMPLGYHEVPVRSGSFGEWLRYLPTKPEGTQVVDYLGAPLEAWTERTHSVLDMDARESQECADVVLRLRAEYLRLAGRDGDIVFSLTSAGRISWPKWKQGFRPHPSGNSVVFERTGRADGSRTSFDAFLGQVFQWCGTISLSKDGKPARPEDLQPGDFLSRDLDAARGHAVLIADVIEDDAGHRLALVVQGAMPAMSPHVPVGEILGAWVPADPNAPFTVPGWRPMEWTLLRRFE